MINRPQVLLLGNGINLAYGGTSWNDFLQRIATREDIINYLARSEDNKLKSPMPLQAILLTNNHIDKRLSEYKQEAFGTISDDNHLAALQKLLSVGFDHILTTNYSYELEMAALGVGVNEAQISKTQTHTKSVNRAESKYLLHTYNNVEFNGVSNKIWHIHGEARKTNSMVLGHYYYGNLLFKIKEYTDKLGNKYRFAQQDKKDGSIKSWIDAFVLGDVYILGFGLDLSEIDLWWLINRKINEKAEHGDIHFYEPFCDEHTGIDERLELIKIFAGKNGGVHNMGISIPTEKEERSAAYRQFYDKAITDISLRITNARQGGNVNG